MADAPEPAKDPKKKFDVRPIYAMMGVCVVLFILVTPVNAVTSQERTYLDSDFRGARSQGLVTSHIALQDPAKLEQVPQEFGEWGFVRSYAWDTTAETISADALISRDYRAPGVNAPASLVIIYSTNMSTFHGPEVCFRLQGWDVVESNATTVEVPKEKQVALSPIDLPTRAFEAKRMVVEKETPRGSVDRMVTLHLYIKHEEQRVTTNAYWIRGSMYIPPGGTQEATEAHLARFMGETVPTLLTLRAPPPQTTIAEALVDKVAGIVQR